MQKEKMREFTVRITESNRTELVAIMYEMIEVYFEDARKAREADDREEFKKQVKNADRVVKELSDILNFKYEISRDLYSLYTYCREQLALTIVKYDTSGIDAAFAVLSKLSQSFHELAKTDDSAPMMQNTQKVAYGMTYGRTDVAENLDITGTNRGFFA